jgi:hypothetical protein
MGHVIETASSGRAKCRGCGEKIDKGELRFGLVIDNPFREGEATYWFHLVCGACRQSEALIEALGATTEDVPDRAWLQAAAEAGAAHPRLQRLAGVQRDPSGRARCRHCRETIDKGAFRLQLQIWEDTRFSPMGFVHAGCGPGYFGVDDIAERLRRLTRGLPREDLEAALSDPIRPERAVRTTEARTGREDDRELPDD